MINYIKNIIAKVTNVKKVSSQEETLIQCNFLNLPREQQYQKLHQDEYYDLVYKTPTKEIKFSDLNPKLSKHKLTSGLPVYKKARIRFDLSSGSLVEQYKPKEQVLIDLFEYLENLLENPITSVFNNRKIEFERMLSSLPESDFKHHSFHNFNKLTQQFNFTEANYHNKKHLLPSYVNPSNTLSKTWLYEHHLKRELFSDKHSLICTYLYCKEQLDKYSIYHLNDSVGDLVNFCADRNFLIYLNEIYDFEFNFLYGSSPNGLVYFQDYQDLFKNHLFLSWTLKILNKEPNKASHFYNELVNVLNNNNALIGNKSNNRFCKFVQEKFNCEMDKLRPSECTSGPSILRIEQLQNDLDFYLKNKN